MVVPLLAAPRVIHSTASLPTTPPLLVDSPDPSAIGGAKRPRKLGLPGGL